MRSSSVSAASGQSDSTAASTAASSADSQLAEVTDDEVCGLLQQLLERDSSLSDKELGHYRGKLNTSLRGLEQKHLCVAKKALELVLEGGDNAPVARDALVQHSLYNSGTATWLVPLRRLVESVQ